MSLDERETCWGALDVLRGCSAGMVYHDLQQHCCIPFHALEGMDCLWCGPYEILFCVPYLLHNTNSHVWDGATAIAIFCFGMLQVLRGHSRSTAVHYCTIFVANECPKDGPILLQHLHRYTQSSVVRRFPPFAVVRAARDSWGQPLTQ